MARFSLAPRKATPNSLNIWTSPLPHLSPFSGSPPCPLLRIPCRSQTTPLRCRCGAVAVRLLLSFNRTRPSKSIHDFSSTQISARRPRDAPLSLKSLLSAIRPQFIRGKPDKTLVGAVSYSNSVHRMLRICHLHIGVFSKSSPPPCVPFVPHFSSLAPQICSAHHGITPWVILAGLPLLSSLGFSYRSPTTAPIVSQHFYLRHTLFNKADACHVGLLIASHIWYS